MATLKLVQKPNSSPGPHSLTYAFRKALGTSLVPKLLLNMNSVRCLYSGKLCAFAAFAPNKTLITDCVRSELIDYFGNRGYDKNFLKTGKYEELPT